MNKPIRVVLLIILTLAGMLLPFVYSSWLSHTVDLLLWDRDLRWWTGIVSLCLGFLVSYIVNETTKGRKP